MRTHRGKRAGSRSVPVAMDSSVATVSGVTGSFLFPPTTARNPKG